MTDGLIRVGRLDDLLESGRTRFRDGDLDLLVVAVAGEVFIVSQHCTHLPAPMLQGPIDVAECSIECPIHQGRFSLRTGAVLEEPPDEPLPVYEVVIQDDEVFARVPLEQSTHTREREDAGRDSRA